MFWSCSTILQYCGIKFPRNTNEQSKFVSNFVHQTKSVSKGTLIFWDGHVGVMTNETEVVHSNMYHLGVHIEKLSNTIKRVGKLQKLKQIKFKNVTILTVLNASA